MFELIWALTVSWLRSNTAKNSVAQLNSTAFFFLPLYVYFEAIKLFMKNSMTVCKLHITHVLF